MKRWFDFSKIGSLVRMFVLSDLSLLAGWGLVQPVFALFIIERIAGATVITVGISAAVYWITKALFQLPVAVFLDKHGGEKDDFLVLMMGLTLSALSALSFVFIGQIWQLYLVQFIHAIGFAMYAPSWSGIFSRHLDENHEAMDWALDNAGMSFAAGVTGLLSGLLVSWFGFPLIFILAGFLSFTAAGIIFAVPKVVFPHRVHRGRKKINDKKPITSVHN